MGKLNVKQRQFVAEYLVDLNATQAAKRAGYSKKTAGQIGERLLRNVEIASAIEEEMKKREHRTLVTADFVIAGLKEVAERCLNKVPVTEWNYEEKRLEQKKDENGNDVWEFDSAGANKAFELLGKHLNLFKGEDKDQVKVTIEIKQIP